MVDFQVALKFEDDWFFWLTNLNLSLPSLTVEPIGQCYSRKTRNHSMPGDNRKVDKLLSELHRVTIDQPLPEDFARGVVMRAREMRRVIRRYWRLLAGATLVALGLAVIFGMRMAESNLEAEAPPLHLFHPADESAPFTVK